MPLTTPVLFLIFNRPDTTHRVFEEIRRARPFRLYIAADGPRSNRKGEAEQCQQAREVAARVDWDCQVFTLFREQNLGCRRAVSSAIDWFFDQVEEGIILEDDCLPDPSFFSFCEEMLDKYRSTPRVMHITGGNYQFGRVRGDGSYYFSRIPHVWGWASWRRAWQSYDVDMKSFPEFVRTREIEQLFEDQKSREYWLYHFRRMYRGSDTWDFQWGYAIFRHRGICVIPNVNLISNIGFGENATNAADAGSRLARIPLQPLTHVSHPSTLAVDEEADYFTMHSVFPKPTLTERAQFKIRGLKRKLGM